MCTTSEVGRAEAGASGPGSSNKDKNKYQNLKERGILENMLQFPATEIIIRLK
jgi:hypothetical protein